MQYVWKNTRKASTLRYRESNRSSSRARKSEVLWKFIDPITEAWEQNLVPLETYKPDTVPQPSLLIADAQNNKEISALSASEKWGPALRETCTRTAGA